MTRQRAPDFVGALPKPQPATPDPRIFLTGATGFLGREVLVRLLRAGRTVLVSSRRRAQESQAELQARLEALVERTDPGVSVTALTATFADVTDPRLGLSEAGQAWMRQPGPVHLVHGAAEVRFDLPIDVMRVQNVQGTLHVLALAQQLQREGRLHRVDHVSTTYVAGDRTDLALETDIDVGQTPRNAYEASKLEAEGEVDKARQAGLPITVHRPSIIVGDSRSGHAASYKVLYWPMKVYARGRFRTVFGRPDCPVDVVPVDYVADALVHLMGSPQALGGTFHLAAGPEGQATIASLAAVAQRVFGRKPVRYIDPDFYFRWLRPILRPILRIFRPDVAERGGVYLPYLRSNPSFDVQKAQAILTPAGISPPPVESYFERIMGYALETNFGRQAALPPTTTPAQDPLHSSVDK